MNELLEKLPAECREDSECLLLEQLRARPEIFAALSETQGSEFSRQERLRREFPEELVRLALSLEELRGKAAGKFARADKMWFDRVGLEQATAEPIARHKAARFPRDAPVMDLCCGIGGDAIALAAEHPVTVIDHNPTALWRTLANADVYGVADRIHPMLGDVESTEIPTDALIHIDPDRRGDRVSRANRLEDYLPGLEFLQQLMLRSRGGAIKVGPASNFGGKFRDVEIELVSLNSECKEATVWFGELAGSEPFRATVLPSGESLAGHPLSAVAPIAPVRKFLYDPNPAVVRAGLVDLCAERLGLARLDAAEEYLTGEELKNSSFVTAFRVLAELPNNDRELRRELRNRQAGAIEIKCRHVPIDADALRRQLPRTGVVSLTIILARISGKARWIVAERIAP